LETTRMARPRIALPTRRSNGNPPPEPVQQASRRFDDIETKVATIQHTLDVQFQRIAALQAELDILSAKVRGH
jgi:hypothetical protein